MREQQTACGCKVKNDEAFGHRVTINMLMRKLKSSRRYVVFWKSSKEICRNMFEWRDRVFKSHLSNFNKASFEWPYRSFATFPTLCATTLGIHQSWVAILPLTRLPLIFDRYVDNSACSPHDWRCFPAPAAEEEAYTLNIGLWILSFERDMQNIHSDVICGHSLWAWRPTHSLPVLTSTACIAICYATSTPMYECLTAARNFVATSDNGLHCQHASHHRMQYAYRGRCTVSHLISVNSPPMNNTEVRGVTGPAAAVSSRPDSAVVRYPCMGLTACIDELPDAEICQSENGSLASGTLSSCMVPGSDSSVVVCCCNLVWLPYGRFAKYHIRKTSRIHVESCICMAYIQLQVGMLCDAGGRIFQVKLYKCAVQSFKKPLLLTMKHCKS